MFTRGAPERLPIKALLPWMGLAQSGLSSLADIQTHTAIINKHSDTWKKKNLSIMSLQCAMLAMSQTCTCKIPDHFRGSFARISVSNCRFILPSSAKLKLTDGSHRTSLKNRRQVLSAAVRAEQQTTPGEGG